MYILDLSDLQQEQLMTLLCKGYWLQELADEYNTTIDVVEKRLRNILGGFSYTRMEKLYKNYKAGHSLSYLEQQEGYSKGSLYVYCQRHKIDYVIMKGKNIVVIEKLTETEKEQYIAECLEEQEAAFEVLRDNKDLQLLLAVETPFQKILRVCDVDAKYLCLYLLKVRGYCPKQFMALWKSQIYVYISKGLTLTEIAKLLGVSVSAVCKCVNNS